MRNVVNARQHVVPVLSRHVAWCRNSRAGETLRRYTRYGTALRMDDRTRQVLTLDAATGVNAGDKVKIVDGTLVHN